MTTRPPLAIVAGVRTPFAKLYGPLAKVNADQLGTIAAAGVMKNLGISPQEIDESIWGNVSGQPDAANIARVISLRAGIPHEKIGHTVNRNCASGMESVITSWQALIDRDSKVILSGGTESMSNVPLFYNRPATAWFLEMQKQKSFWGKLGHFFKFRPGFLSPVPGLKLGLTDPVCKLNMGETAENLVADFSISREEQDQFALASHQRVEQAIAANFFEEEMTPVTSPYVEGQGLNVDVGPRKGQSIEALGKLRPVFKKEQGTVTAGNSSQITDGAVALIVCLADEAKARGWEPLGYLRDYAIAGVDPSRMGLGPVFAIDKLLNQTQKKLSDFERVEINEAFASQVIACVKAMKSEEFCREKLNRSQAIGELKHDILNVNGGAIALGHPVGATGARLILTLLRELKRNQLKDGLASLCIGGGQGYAMWLSTTLDPV